LENVFVDLKKKTFQLGDLQLQTKDIDIPLDNGFLVNLTFPTFTSNQS